MPNIVPPFLQITNGRHGKTPMGMDRDRRHQEEAVLDARLSRLRKSLNVWWAMSGSGKEIASNRLAVLAALDEAAEQLERIKRLRR